MNKNCQLHRQEETIPPDKDPPNKDQAQKIARKLYTEKIDLYHRLFFSILKWDKAIRSFFEQSDYVHSDSKILDAGCGSGLITKILQGITERNGLRNVSFDGFDITPAMLERFREWVEQNGVTNVRLQQGDILRTDKLPADWKNYDIVITSAVLEHLPREEVQKALEGLRGLLKEGGRIVILITRRNWVTGLLVKKLFKANTYFEKEVRDMVLNAGFRDVIIKKLPSQYRLLNRGLIIIEAKK